MSARRYKCKRHVAPELREAGLWLVYDSENGQRMPILHKRSRAQAAEGARMMNSAGITFHPGGEDQRQRDLRLARDFYLRITPGTMTDLWGTRCAAYVAAARRVTREEALKPRRALDLGF